jgi:Spy/CpxP family protein refolding chaperone
MNIMRTGSRYHWMIWAIIALALMNVTTFATILVNRGRTVKTGMLHLPEQAYSDRTSLRYSGRYFRDHLGLTREQMSRFTEFNPVFRRNAREINISLAELRRQMMIEMSAETSDTVKLNTISDSIGRLHSRLKKISWEYYLDLKNICNKEQEAKLEEMFGSMFTPDGQEFRRGPGGFRNPPGRGQGRRPGI